MTRTAEWRQYELGDLLDFSNGINADKSAYGHGVPFINVLEVITNESLTEDDIPGLITLPPKVLARYHVHRGDVLLNRTSETQEEVGLTSVYLGKRPVVFGGFVFRGRPKTSVLDVSFAKYALRATDVREQIIARGQGGIRANVGQRDLRSVVVHLPEPLEQGAIAEALDDASALASALKKTIAKKRLVKQGLMQDLLTGRVRLPGFTSGWPSPIAVKQVVSRFSGYWGRGPGVGDVQAKIIRAGDVLAQGGLSGYADRSLTRSEAQRARCNPGDVVLTSSGTIGNVALIKQPGYYASNFVRVLRPDVSLDGTYLYYALQSFDARRAMNAHLGVSAMTNLGSGFYSERWLRAPEKSEQLAIAEVLLDADAEIEALVRRLEVTRAIKQGMMQELLTGRTRLVGEGAA